MFTAPPEAHRPARSASPDGHTHPLPANHLPAVSAFRRARARAIPVLAMGAVMPALLGAAILPAYEPATIAAAHAAALEAYTLEEAQTVSIAATVVDPAVAERDAYEAISAADMAAAAAAAQRALYSGPGVRDLLANPPYPNYDMNTIVAIAMQYQGVPYRYAGSDPSGFDCSGFTMFVFAHVGIALPHSSSAQGRMTAIAPEAALPGDLVILDGGGHVGIYVGGGQMIDSPRPGGVVSVRPMWGSYWFVRPGI